MAGRALSCTVILDGTAWRADTVPPPAVAARIRNPQCWADAEATEPAGPTEPVSAVPEAEPPAQEPAQGVAAESDPAVPEVVETPSTAGPPPVAAPPRSGAGSGLPAWRAFGQARDVDFERDATRDEIIAACEEAGVL